MTEAVPNPSADAAESDLSGRQLGDFRLLRRLGRGAMAEVYLAEQSSLRRQVAIKVLKNDLAKDETYVKRFHNEAQAAASLVHANIVQIHEVGCVDGIHYIAQEYVQGQNLREWMARHGPPDVRMALTIMRQVAAALHKAAGQGIVHRDIKPENIMLARTGEVKVADFGLARLAGDGAALNLTQVGVTMGTPLYMSPEQVEGRPLDPRSDIYSFGVTCYQMLSGVTPFRGDTALAVALQHLKSQPDRLENLRPDLPAGLSRIIHRMLAKEPAQRYATTRDLLSDLRGVPLKDDGGEWPDEAADFADVDTFPLAARGEATQRLDALMKTSSMRTVRRRPLAWGIVLLGSLIAGGAAAWLAREPFILAGAPRTVIPHASTAREQFFNAQLLGSESGFQSVIDYFGDSPAEGLYVARARQELAWLYLSQKRFDDALPLFAELAHSDEPESRAFGLAGQAVTLTLMGRYPEAAQALGELPELREKNKIDPRMFPPIRWAIGVNRKQLDAKTRADLDELTKQAPAEDEFDPGAGAASQGGRGDGPNAGRDRR